MGLELFGAAGPETVSALTVEGYRVFLDLKLHDIPTTVLRAARVLGGLGVAFATVHTQGGEAMVRAAVAGMAEGAAAAGAPAPCVLGVTVLTSDTDAPAGALAAPCRQLAAAAGCGGLVCAAADLAVTRRAAPGLVTVVPGIRPSGTSADDQARAADPGRRDGGRRGHSRDRSRRHRRRGPRGQWRPQSLRKLRRRWPHLADDPRSRGRYGGPHAATSRTHPRAAPGGAGQGRQGPPRAGRGEGEAEDGVHHPVGSSSQRAEKDETVGKMKVLSVLESLPGLGKVKARRLMETVGISESRRLQGLGANQRDALLTHTSKS